MSIHPRGKVYNVTLEFSGTVQYEIEAKDDETAEELAIDRLHDSVGGDVDVDVVDAVVTLSDNQYTQTQESIDDERRHEDRDQSI